MPMKPLTPCRYPGCPELCSERYCEKHKKEIDKHYNKYERDKKSQKFYQSAEWKAVRKQKLLLNPLCEECQRKGKLRKATMVDHITPIKQGGSALGLENLQCLCWRCHSEKSAREGSRWGKR